MYSEAGLRALDYVLYVSSQLGLRVILSLVDNWHYYNGIDQVGVRGGLKIVVNYSLPCLYLPVLPCL